MKYVDGVIHRADQLVKRYPTGMLLLPLRKHSRKKSTTSSDYSDIELIYFSSHKIVHPTNKKILKTACGAEFSVFIDENNLLYSFGRPEHGQLGHNTDGQYFVTSNKLAFDCEVLPRHVAVFVEKTKDGFTHIVDDVKIVDVACGNNHTVRHNICS